MADFNYSLSGETKEKIAGSFDSAPEARRTIDQILSSVNLLPCKERIEFYSSVADEMAKSLYPVKRDDQVFVFSKDKYSRYGFKPATRLDRILSYVLNMLPN
jgi:hypothetical protein